MKNSMLVSGLVTGAIALSLGLVGCGLPSLRSVEKVVDTDKDTNATSMPAPDSAAVLKTPSETLAQSVKGHLWMGTTDIGQQVYMTIDSSDNAIVLIFQNDADDTALFFEGKAVISEDGSTLQVTDRESSEQVTIVLNVLNADGTIAFDAADHGKGTFQPIEQEQFDAGLAERYGVSQDVPVDEGSYDEGYGVDYGFEDTVDEAYAEDEIG